MRQQDWQGVFPAVTTPFNPDLSVNLRCSAAACFVASGLRVVKESFS